MSYDLSVRAPYGVRLTTEDRDRLLERWLAESEDVGLCEITNLELDGELGDHASLMDLIRDGEFSQADFESFCKAHDLAADDRGARGFIDSRWGQDLFSLGLPSREAEVKRVYRQLLDFARANGVIVHDPQLGEEVTTDNSDVPPMWR